MKKRISLVLIVFCVMGLVVGCNSSSLSASDENEDGISLTAVINEVSDTELLVTVLDNENFDQARVNMQGFDSLDFLPQVGQKLKLVIKSQMGMSMPPYVNPIEIELVK